MISATVLRDEVIANLEISSTDYTRFKVYEHLNQIQLTLINILPLKYLSQLVKTSKFNLAANIFVIQWPDDFVRYIKMWLDYDYPITASNRGVEVTIFDPSIHIQTMDLISSQRFPFVDLDVEKGFEIQPVPDANIIDGGRLRFVYYPPNISDTQDALIDYRCKNLLVWGATSLCSNVDNYRPDMAKTFWGYYQDELKLFRTKDQA